MTIGERIKQKRLELGMSQEELAQKCGYKSRTSINKIELSRDVPLKKVAIIAKALDVRPAYLLDWQEEEIYIEETIEADPKILSFMNEISEYIEKITDTDRAEIINYIKYKASNNTN